MDASTHYTLQPSAGSVEEADGSVSITDDGLVLRGGESVYRFEYRDIEAIDADNYQVELTIEPETRLVLSKLGRQYEDVVRVLYDRRNAILVEDLLLAEPLRLSGIDADLEYHDPKRSVTIEGECEVRLYETGIVFLSRTDLPVRLPYGTVVEVSTENYTLRIETDVGEVAVLSKLGRRFDELQRTLSDLRSELTETTVELLEQYLPEADPVVLSRLAKQMRDGRAVSRHEVSTSVGEEVWEGLEASLEKAGIGSEYDYVAPDTVTERVSIGIKRGLRSDTESEYLWVLLPVADIDHTKPGNAIVMEAAGDSTARATYLFQIVPYEEYVEIADRDALDRTVTEAISDLNRAMLGVNFRREPIYLSREQLSEPRYATYRSALRLVPALSRLRDAFLGRVVHRSTDQWRRDVDELLATAVTPGMEDESESTGTKPGPQPGSEV